MVWGELNRRSNDSCLLCQAALLLFVCAASAGCKPQAPPAPPERQEKIPRSLDEIVADEVSQGWRVIRPPEVKGPYTRLAFGSQTECGKEMELTLYRQETPVVSRHEGKAGVYYQVIALNNTDGVMDYVLLERDCQ